MVETSTVADTVEKLNKNMFLPGLQREFVWDKKDIIYLFDSVMQGYPIGGFLYWERNDIDQNQIMYEFVRDYITENVAPNELKKKKLQNHNVEIDDYEKSNYENKNIRLVLDGQQRLSAFYIGMNGSYTELKDTSNREDVDSWKVKQRLHIDLLADKNKKTGDMDTKYSFKFFERSPEQTADSYWFPIQDVPNNEEDLKEKVEWAVGEIQDLKPEEEFNYHEVYGKVIGMMQRLHRRLYSDNVIEANTVSSSTPSEDVLEIFVRTNDRGVELKNSQILLSILTHQWSNVHNMNARQEINNIKDNIEEKYSSKGYSLDVEDIVKAFAVFIGRGADYSISSFTEEDFDKARELRDKKEVETSLEKAIKTSTEIGFDGGTASNSLIIPLAYFIHEKGESAVSQESELGRNNRKKIQYWICAALLNRTFVRRPPLTNKVTELIDGSEGQEFPLEEISQISSHGYTVEISESVVDDAFDKKSPDSSSQAFALFSLIYYPGLVMENKYDLDHIFPDDMFEKEKLMGEHGMSEREAKRCMELKDSVANRQMLTPEDNRWDKNDEPPQDWMPKMSDSYFERHKVPEDEEYWKIENFLDFVEKRQDMIVERIEERFGSLDSVNSIAED